MSIRRSVSGPLLVAALALAAFSAGAIAGNDDLIFADGFDPPTPAACGWVTAPGTPGDLSGPDASSVSALYPWQGKLFVGSNAGDTFNGALGGLASMDPVTYETTTLGDAELVDGFTNAFIPFDAGDGSGEKLYVLGAFNGISVGGNTLPNSRVIVSWDGSSIATLPDAPLQPLDFLWTGQVLDGKLAIAGSRATGDQEPLLALWDGTNWQTWADQFTGTVAPVILTSAVFQGKLYIGGRFSGVNQPDGMGGQTLIASSNLMAFDGSTFSSVGGGLKLTSSSFSQVLAMATFDDGSGEALYIGGRFDEAVDGTPLFAIAKWDGSTFSAVGPGFPAPKEVRGLAVYDDGSGSALYATGTFTADTNGLPMARFAKWNGTTWSEVGGGIGANPGPMVALPGIGLSVGGSFTTVGDPDAPEPLQAGGLAYWARECPPAKAAH
jgi:hypothetical protein